MSAYHVDLRPARVYQTIRAVCLHTHARPLRAMLLGAAIPSLLYMGYVILHGLLGTSIAGAALPAALLISGVMGVLGGLGSLVWAVLQALLHATGCSLTTSQLGSRARRGLLLVVLNLIPLGAIPRSADPIYVELEQRPFFAEYIRWQYGLILKDETAAWSESEARIVYETLADLEWKMAQVTGEDGQAIVKAAWDGVTLARMARTNNPFGNFAWTPPSFAGRRIEVPDFAPENGWWREEIWTKHILSDELAHAWDFLYPDIGGWNGGHLSSELPLYVGADASLCLTRLVCGLGDNVSVYDPGEERTTNVHSAQSPVEDWSGSFAQFMQPLPDQSLGPKRDAYVRSSILLLASRIR